MDKDDWKVLLVVLWVLYHVVKFVMDRGKAQVEAQGEAQGEAEVPEAPPSPAVGDLEEIRTHALTGSAGLLARITTLQDEARSLSVQASRLRGPVRVIDAVLSEHVVDLLKGLRQFVELKRSEAQRAGDFATLRDAVEAVQADWFDHNLRLCGHRLHVLTVLLASRSTRAGAMLLEDADATAGALLEPLRAYAESLKVGAFQQRPICVPVEPGYEAVSMGLFPGRPIVFVPEDMGRLLHRWASLAHEMGHVLFHQWPDYALEVRSKLGLDIQNTLAREPSEFSMDAMLSGWLDELHADAVATLCFGPALPNGLMRCFSGPEGGQNEGGQNEGGQNEVEVHTTDGQTYEAHPPAALRIRWTAALLSRMGFLAEAAEMEKAIRLSDGGPEHLLVPLRGGRRLVSIPFERVYEAGLGRLMAFYDLQLQTMAGARLADVPGLEMSPGLWARVRRRATELSSGQATHDDARVLLAAALLAQTKSPGWTSTIEAALRKAVLGLDSDERRAPDRNYGERASADLPRSHPGSDDVLGGLIWREILRRPHGRRRPSAQRASAKTAP